MADVKTSRLIRRLNPLPSVARFASNGKPYSNKSLNFRPTPPRSFCQAMSFFPIKQDRLEPVVMMLVCFSLLFCNTWIPVPISIEKDLSVPFPCQSKGCGCKNATQCWESCCCHSDSEKLAWAAKHGVRPPHWFTPQAIAGTDSNSSNRSSGNESSPVEMETGTKPVKGCCCCHKQNPVAQPSSNDSDTKRVLLILKQQNACQGNTAVDGFHKLKIQLCGAAPISVVFPQRSQTLLVFYAGVPQLAEPQWDPLPS